MAEHWLNEIWAPCHDRAAHREHLSDALLQAFLPKCNYFVL